MARDTLLECFIAGYISAACWTSHPDGDVIDSDELSTDALVLLHRECEAFYTAHAAIIHCDGAPLSKDDSTASESERVAAMAGHDFWLTRNGHGAGFWDGDWPEPSASVLDAVSKAAGGCELYQGDDGAWYAY